MKTGYNMFTDVTVTGLCVCRLCGSIVPEIVMGEPDMDPREIHVTYHADKHEYLP